MPKVQVDVDVTDQQQIKDLNAQVISLQQSLDKLKTTAQGQPFQPVTQGAQQATTALDQVNQQIDETTTKVQKFQQQNPGLAGLGQKAWAALDTASTLQTAYGAAVGAPAAYRWAAARFGGPAAAEALPAASAAGTGSFLTGLIAPVAIGAGALYGTNRAADYVQNQILQARSMGMSVDQLNNLQAVAAGTRPQALPGLQQLYQGTDTNNPAWRDTGIRYGLAVGKGDDVVDTLAQLSEKIRQMPQYEDRVKAVQALYPGGDPGQILDALNSNLVRMAQRLDDEKREIDPSATANLTKFKDMVNDLSNLPERLTFEWEILQQKLAVGTINTFFADRNFTGPIGTRTYTGAALPAGTYGPREAGVENRSPEELGMSALLEASDDAKRQQTKAAQDARDVQNVKDTMKALGVTSGAITYAPGQTLTADTASIEKATKWANDYLNTWMTKGPGASAALAENVKRLQSLDEEITRLGTKDLTPGAPRTTTIANREALQQTVYQQQKTVTTGMIEQSLRDQINLATRQPSFLELQRTDQLQFLNLQNAFNATARPTPFGTLQLEDRFQDRQQGIQLYNAFRNKADGTAPEQLLNFLSSRQGREGQIEMMRRQAAKIYGPDISADVNFNKVIGMLQGDITRQNQQTLAQQQAGFGMQITQATAEPGQERETAVAIYNQQTAAAREYYGYTLKNKDDELKLQLQLNQAAEQYTLTILQLEQIEKRRANAFPSQVAQAVHGFNLQMIGLTTQPGDEMQGFGRTFEENQQFAADQMRRNIMLGGMTLTEASRQYELQMGQARQGRTLAETGFQRQRQEQARGFDIQDITSTTQLDVSKLQLWAVPGQERTLQALVNAREQQGLQDQIARAGGTYSPRQVQEMYFQQGIREQGAGNQLDRQDYLRQRDQDLQKVQMELQLTTQIVTLRNDGEFITAKKTHELRLDALQKELDLTGDIYDYGKKEREENLSYQQQLNQINAQRKAEVQGQAGTFFDDIWGSSIGRRGGPDRPLAGVRSYFQQVGGGAARTVFTNIAGEFWKQLADASHTGGGLISGQVDDQGQLTRTGRILKGTFLGVDQSKLVQNAAVAATTTNTGATTTNTTTTATNTAALNALSRMIAAMPRMMSGGCGCGGGSGGGGYSPMNWGYSPANWGSSTAVPSIPQVDSLVRYDNFVNPDDMAGGSFVDPTAGYTSDGSGYSQMSGFSQMSPDQAAAVGGGGAVPMGYDYGSSSSFPSMPGSESLARARAIAGPSALAVGVGKGAAAAAAAYGTYSGIKRGGLGGGLQAASAMLGGAALFSGPAAAPFLAAASIIAGTVSAFLPDPVATRMRQEDDWIRNSQFKPPDPVQLTVNVNGQAVDYNFKGQIRSYATGVAAGLGTTGTPKASIPPIDNVVAAAGGGFTTQTPKAIVGGPMVIQNFHMLDTQSLMARRSEIAEVTRAALDDFHPLRQTIQQISR